MYRYTTGVYNPGSLQTLNISEQGLIVLSNQTPSINHEAPKQTESTLIIHNNRSQCITRLPDFLLLCLREDKSIRHCQDLAIKCSQAKNCRAFLPIFLTALLPAEVYAATSLFDIYVCILYSPPQGIYPFVSVMSPAARTSSVLSSPSIIASWQKRGHFMPLFGGCFGGWKIWFQH